MLIKYNIAFKQTQTKQVTTAYLLQLTKFYGSESKTIYYVLQTFFQTYHSFERQKRCCSSLMLAPYFVAAFSRIMLHAVILLFREGSRLYSYLLMGQNHYPETTQPTTSPWRNIEIVATENKHHVQQQNKLFFTCFKDFASLLEEGHRICSYYFSI